MKQTALIFFILFSVFAFSQPYNRLVKWNLGFTRPHLQYIKIKNEINDTGQVNMEFLSWTPSISYSHEFIFGKVLSVSGTAGFQYLNIYYGPKHYGAPFFYLTVNPQVSIVYRKNFEFYMKLKAGASFFIHQENVLPATTQRFVPETVNLITGVTLGGFNYFINDKLGLNLELSVWSVEMATFGLTYRFFKGELPEIQNAGQEINNQIENKTP